MKSSSCLRLVAFIFSSTILCFNELQAQGGRFGPVLRLLSKPKPSFGAPAVSPLKFGIGRNSLNSIHDGIGSRMYESYYLGSNGLSYSQSLYGYSEAPNSILNSETNIDLMLRSLSDRNSLAVRDKDLENYLARTSPEAYLEYRSIVKEMYPNLSVSGSGDITVPRNQHMEYVELSPNRVKREKLDDVDSPQDENNDEDFNGEDSDDSNQVSLTKMSSGQNSSDWGAPQIKKAVKESNENSVAKYWIAGVLFFYFLISSLGISRIFLKTRTPRWMAFFPFLRVVDLFEICGMKRQEAWWLLVPGANIFYWWVLNERLCKVFQYPTSVAFLGFFLPGLLWWKIGYSNKYYTGTILL